MIEQHSGSIVNTMSSAVWVGETERVAYQTAKSGLVGLTRHTSTLGGKHGVRTNLLSPGVTLTGSALKNTTEEYREQTSVRPRAPA
jgi:NAD(P)-dependent dehydrogenase (short-subunit alcohol dehydrogenase family)